MPKFHVEKSVLINVPKDKLVQVLSDFNQWIPWSPWLLMEAEAVVNVREDKHHYSWQGKRVGEGNMTLLNTEHQANTSTLTYDLEFLKPWKSTADVAFVLVEKGESTEVTWMMDSALPFFLFWMKKLMIVFIGMDYNRGLSMLKEYLETGEIQSSISFLATQNEAKINYIGIKETCSFEDIGPSMEPLFTQLGSFAEINKDIIAGEMISIYHKWEMSKKLATYTAALSVSSIPSNLPDNMYVGTINAHRAVGIRHVGHYKHLGNAWSTLYTMERNKEIKCAKGIAPYERYINSPHENESKDLITDLKFPIQE